MRRVSGGYTIIEVMMVLSITAVLFTSAIYVFQGQQSKTTLSQNMFDFASKLKGYVSEINSGIYTDSNNYSCSVSNSKATLTSSGGSTGSNEACLFIGRAIQVIPNSSDIYAYTVIGNRDLYSSGNDTGQNSQSLEDTNPQIANVNGSMVLVDKYSLSGSITVESAKAVDTTGNTLSGYGDLVGLYQDISGSGAGTNLEAIAFPFPTGNGQNTPYSSALSDCVSLGSGCASTTNGYGGSGYQRINNWYVCVKQSGGAHAEVKVKVSSAGIATEVDTQACS